MDIKEFQQQIDMLHEHLVDAYIAVIGLRMADVDAIDKKYSAGKRLLAVRDELDALGLRSMNIKEVA